MGRMRTDIESLHSLVVDARKAAKKSDFDGLEEIFKAMKEIVADDKKIGKHIQIEIIRIRELLESIIEEEIRNEMTPETIKSSNEWITTGIDSCQNMKDPKYSLKIINNIDKVVNAEYKLILVVERLAKRIENQLLKLRDEA